MTIYSVRIEDLEGLNKDNYIIWAATSREFLMNLSTVIEIWMKKTERLEFQLKVSASLPDELPKDFERTIS
ncbi:MAG: hypothetical protein QW231_00220 [Candidatus Bathyarchaeia archaeon]